jgi:hypothetical protein
MTNPAPAWQGPVITDSPIPRLLRARPAIVLERIARGGGATTWFHCHNQNQLDAIAAQLHPGSVVSFYFDDRIAYRHYTPQLHQQMLRIIAATGDLVVGQLAPDGLHIEVDYPATPNDLDEYTQTLGTHSHVYVGAFPGRDNDTTNAVTLTLPDLDGVTRAHPH